MQLIDLSVMYLAIILELYDYNLMTIWNPDTKRKATWEWNRILLLLLLSSSSFFFLLLSSSSSFFFFFFLLLLSSSFFFFFFILLLLLLLSSSFFFFLLLSSSIALRSNADLLLLNGLPTSQLFFKLSFQRVILHYQYLFVQYPVQPSLFWSSSYSTCLRIFFKYLTNFSFNIHSVNVTNPIQSNPIQSNRLIQTNECISKSPNNWLILHYIAFSNLHILQFSQVLKTFLSKQPVV